MPALGHVGSRRLWDGLVTRFEEGRLDLDSHTWVVCEHPVTDGSSGRIRSIVCMFLMSSSGCVALFPVQGDLSDKTRDQARDLLRSTFHGMRIQMGFW